jgi:hypothetical protein
MRRLLMRVVLGLVGVALAAVIALGTLLAFGRQDILEQLIARCQQADGDWYSMVLSLTQSYPTPCSTFYWDVYPTGEFYNLISVNNYGLHDTDLSLDKPPDTFRILVIGDSFPQAWQVKLEEGFPWLLEQALNEGASRRIEVINLSVDTYGTDRQLLLYAALGWRFQPDAVLLTFYTGNDVRDNSYWLSSLHFGQPLARPVFTLNAAGGLQLHNAPDIDPGRFAASPEWTWLARLSNAQTPLPERPLPGVPRVKTEVPYDLEYPVDLGLYMAEDSYWADAWALTEALIVQFRNLVEDKGATFGVVVIPDRRAIHDSDWDTTVSIFPFMRGYDLYAPGDRIEAFLEAQGIPVLNLTYTLRGWASSNAGERLYYIGDGHFNKNGHSVAAQRIVLWLREVGLLE